MVRGRRSRIATAASFDTDLIHGLLGAVEEADRGWSSFVNEAAVDALEMGLSAGVDLQVQTRRQFDETNSGWIAPTEPSVAEDCQGASATLGHHGVVFLDELTEFR